MATSSVHVHLRRFALAPIIRPLVQSLDALEQWIWKNPHGLSPEQVFELLGGDGGRTLALAEELRGLLTALLPAQTPNPRTPTVRGPFVSASLRPKGLRCTVGDDGIVALGPAAAPAPVAAVKTPPAEEPADVALPLSDATEEAPAAQEAAIVQPQSTDPPNP
jgi:hypothetical protein